MGIGDKIKKRRIELGLSQDELAKKTGYTSRSSINKIELGINDITQSKVIVFADVLQTSPAYLMDWDDNVSDLGNNQIMANNIKRYMKIFNKSRADICNDLNIKYSTFTDWVNAKKYPRIDKIEMLANYFNIEKSDLVENKSNNLNRAFNKYSSFVKLPLYQSISCGNGGFVEDSILEYITIPDKMLRKGKEYFACYAEGNSMIDENIQSGDLIIFEKTSIVNNGDIGCFCIDDNQATCKRFRKDTRTGMIMLLPANNDYEPIMVTLENQNFRVIGKLALVINNRQK